MRQATPTQLNDSIVWNFVTEDDKGNQHYMERRLYRRGEVIKVLSLLIFPSLVETEFGEAAQSQYCEVVDVKARRFRMEQEALIDPEGELLHVSEFVDGFESGCPLGSVNEARMQFIEKLLHDCKRRKLRLPLRRGTNKIRIINKRKK